MTRPVLLADPGLEARACASRRTGRRCGGTARRWRCQTGRPLARSQTMVVSRWLVMPMAAIWEASTRRLRQDVARRRQLGVPYLLRVVLHPAGVGVDLGEGVAGLGDRRPRVVEEDGARAGRSLVEGKDVTRHRSLGGAGLHHYRRGESYSHRLRRTDSFRYVPGAGEPACRREGGIDHAHVAATASTPPIAHNARQTTPCDETQGTWVIIVIREEKAERQSGKGDPDAE